MDALAEGDPRREDVYEIAFRLEREDPDNQDTSTMWPFGNGWEPGWTLDLPDGSGFVGAVIIHDAHTDEAIVALIHFVLF